MSTVVMPVTCRVVRESSRGECNAKGSTLHGAGIPVRHHGSVCDVIADGQDRMAIAVHLRERVGIWKGRHGQGHCA